ncbi:MAG TPA: hypothetical protein VIV58_01070, partial [Kofleriaceae bacterium]
MDARLQRAIQTPRIQSQAWELVSLAQRALDDLRQLDDSLYERFVATRDAPADPKTAAESLEKLWDTTFGGLRQLLWACRSMVDLQGADLEGDARPTGANPVVTDDELDFGELAEPAAKEDDLALGSADLLDFLEQIDEQEHEDDSKRWDKVIERVGSIEYGLTSQQNEAKERLKVALSTGEIGHALGVLDDTQSSASEGVHALVTAVYDAFVPDVNPTTVVPGYLTALGRALLVRRGVAELAMNLAPFNDQLQAGDPSTYEAALSAVRATLQAYVGSVVCRAMRPADRWQMVEFERQLQTEPPAVARLTSEGLVKYLDSLGSINQREVLVMHDRRTLDTMREAVANARQLLDLSPRAAVEMMDRGYQAAQRLKGRSPVTDKLFTDLEKHSPHSANPGE